MIRPLAARILEHQTRHDVDDALFCERVRPIASHAYAAILLSGGNGDCARYSLAAWDPLLCLTAKGRTLCLTTPDGQEHIQGDPLSILDDILSGIQADYPLIEPFAGGVIGYLAYELKNTIERLPQTARDDHQLPELMVFFPSRIMIHDRQARTLTTVRIGDPESRPIPANRSVAPDPALHIGELASNFTRPAYLEALARIRDYIEAGDVYQVNLSQRLAFDLRGDPFLLWQQLYAVNPAPFYAYINAGDHQVLSTSMERFLFRRGTALETRPIKGTRRRGNTPHEDAALSRDLMESPKDDAELSMIVDLMRNDLGRVCREVRMREHKRREAYQNVFHLVSIVSGELPPAVTAGTILRATFPGGSVTGCPKIRALEIIDELEPHVRHVYTGAIGYVGMHENMDLNVAIRTALCHAGRCYFSVGGGVVYDSRAADEYEETLYKARTLFQVVRGGRNAY